jgi:CBS domain-containing protein
MSIQSVLDRNGDRLTKLRYEASVKQAADLLRERDAGALVVTEGQAIVGVISERDIVIALSWLGEPALYMPVGAVANRNMVAIGPDAGLKTAMTLMRRYGVRHLLVIKDGTLVGLVSTGDVANHCLDEPGFDAGVLHDTHFATH